MRVVHDETDVIPSVVNNGLTAFVYSDWLYFYGMVNKQILITHHVNDITKLPAKDK